MLPNEFQKQAQNRESINNSSCNTAPEYISDIRVELRDSIDPPDGAILEVNSASNDINNGFGGKFVYLVPQYTTNPRDAITGISVVAIGGFKAGFTDMASGAGGSYRYLIPEKSGNRRRVTTLRLFRTYTSSDLGGQKDRSGLGESTNDINEGRGKTYLYLLYALSKDAF